MRVSDFDDFDRFETEGLLTGSKERSWLWFGLIVSLGIHLALCAYFYRTRFQTVEALIPPNEQTPTFKVRSINTSDLGKSSVDQTSGGKTEPGQYQCAVARRKEIVRQAIAGRSSKRGDSRRHAGRFA